MIRQYLLFILRIISGLAGIAMVLLGIWMIYVKDLIFCFYSLMIAVLLLQFAIRKRKHTALQPSDDRMT